MKYQQGKTFSDKVYCSSPFNSIFLQVNGRVSSCCASTYNWGNINYESLDEIIHSDTAQDVRKDVLSGNKTNYCDNCVRQENFSGTSERTHFQEFVVDTDKEFELKSLDLRWSNICNFSCMYCNENFSSTWAKKKGLKANTDNLKLQDNILNYVDKHKSKIGKIMLAGGEPLLQMQNEKLLNLLPNHTRITIITNLGVDLSKSSLFKKFAERENILWSISLENFKQEFEYVRQGGDWNRLLENIKYIKENTNHKITFLSVFSIFTIENLDKFIKFADNQKIDILWQSIDGNGFALHPEFFSNKVRKYIVQRIDEITKIKTEINYNKEYLIGYRDKIKSMIEKNEEYNEVDLKFRKFIEKNENKFNTTTYKFEEMWPILNNLIKK